MLQNSTILHEQVEALREHDLTKQIPYSSLTINCDVLERYGAHLLADRVILSQQQLVQLLRPHTDILRKQKASHAILDYFQSCSCIGRHYGATY